MNKNPVAMATMVGNLESTVRALLREKVLLHQEIEACEARREQAMVAFFAVLKHLGGSVDIHADEVGHLPPGVRISTQLSDDRKSVRVFLEELVEAPKEPEGLIQGPGTQQ